MPTIPTPHLESTLADEDEFLEILCSDEDLVRAEFDAIIAAEWPSLPPDAPDDDDTVERSPGRTRCAPRGGQAGLPDRPRHPGIGGWSRERSPPPGGSTTETRKEGDGPT
ncbi:MAG: hypothetical protein QOH56_1902 [Pseudonocardiales bacterium]|nr:hypothetical protein [Pseudonocardiales bacterium]